MKQRDISKRSYPRYFERNLFSINVCFSDQ